MKLIAIKSSKLSNTHLKLFFAKQAQSAIKKISCILKESIGNINLHINKEITTEMYKEHQ